MMIEHDIEMLDAFKVKETGRFRIVLNIEKREADMLLARFAASKFHAYDRCIWSLKRILCGDDPPVKSQYEWWNED